MVKLAPLVEKMAVFTVNERVDLDEKWRKNGNGEKWERNEQELTEEQMKAEQMQ